MRNCPSKMGSQRYSDAWYGLTLQLMYRVATYSTSTNAPAMRPSMTCASVQHSFSGNTARYAGPVPGYTQCSMLKHDTMVGMYSASSMRRLSPVKSSNSTAGMVFQSTAVYISAHESAACSTSLSSAAYAASNLGGMRSMSTSQKAKSPAYADHCRKKKVGNAAPRMSPVANRNMWRASFDGHGTGSAKTKDHRLITFQGVLDVGYRGKGSEVFGVQDSILGFRI
mmetsp:Transcript_39496/g.63328  ORF Transcript_39496/g.63328 Transcript_39496/m.63328 type:complete len:225 (-) Transcript_39496:178-852(-)